MPVPSPVLAAGLGWVAGMRSMMPVALLSHALNERRWLPWTRRRRQPARLLADRQARPWLLLAAAGELVADKLPMTPGRTEPPGLAARIAAGAAAGAAVAEIRGTSVIASAAVGAAASAASSFAMMRLRAAAVEETGAPDPALALVEDALAVGIGYACAEEAVR